MDSNKIIKITNSRQFEKLVELLEQNPNLARGFSCGTNKVNVKEEWKKIAEKLNVLGPPVRTGEGWMKVWADYKFKLKKKLTHNKNECHATGGGPYKQFMLSATEEAASNLLQLDSIFNARPAFGIQRKTQKNVKTSENIFTEVNIAVPEEKESEQPCSSNIANKNIIEEQIGTPENIS